MSAAVTLAGAAPDLVPGWHSTPWRKVWHNVRRLQARIVKAVQEGRWGKVQALVYLLTHSWSGRALAILRVTTNAGASTPGVDGECWDTPELKAAAFSRLRRHGYHAQPLRRVYIPKSSDPSKLRPLAGLSHFSGLSGREIYAVFQRLDQFHEFAWFIRPWLNGFV